MINYKQMRKRNVKRIDVNIINKIKKMYVHTNLEGKGLQAKMF